MIYHVRFACAADYMARRLPYRPAHLRQLEKLRTEGRVVAGGPEPDAVNANIFYRVADRGELDRLLAENEFNRAGLFSGATPRAFTEFLEPIDLPPVDAGLHVTIVEGAVADRIRVLAALAELRQSGLVAFGGIFGDGAGLAVVRVPDAENAVRAIAELGGWAAGSLHGRPWSQTL